MPQVLFPSAVPREEQSPPSTHKAYNNPKVKHVRFNSEVYKSYDGSSKVPSSLQASERNE